VGHFFPLFGDPGARLLQAPAFLSLERRTSLRQFCVRASA
jgi:hypothetical protein